MRESDQISRLERIYGLIAGSFLRYVVEASGPLVQDDWDKRALEKLRAWLRSEGAALERIEGILAAEKIHPAAGGWPVEFSQYNYLLATYLLKPLIARMGSSLGLLEAEAAALRGWPEAEGAVGGYLKEARAHLAAIEAFERDRPREPPRPGAKKGVSASRW